MADPKTPPFRPETLAISHGWDPEDALRSAKPPIFMTATFTYPSAQTAKDVHRAYFDGDGPEAGGALHIYSRLGHPGLDILEARLAAIDGAEAALAYCSGMAAHTAVALAYLKPGEGVVHGRPFYSGVDGLFNEIMPQFGAHGTAWTDGCDEANMWAACEAAMAKGPVALLAAESPGNPTAALVDLDLLVKIAGRIEAAQGRRPIVMVDNTLLGPFHQRPIEHGVDLVVTSLTKYCAGHSDLLAGAISGRKDLIAPLKLQRLTWGNHLDPYNAWLVLRSLETVHIRTERAMENALAVAEWLRAHPKVAGVTYLGFTPEGTAARAVFERQCRGAGSTFSFHLHGGEAEAFRMLDQLRLLKMAVNLGGSNTLICHSASTTHYAVSSENRLASGITDGTIRLSVGLEHVDDIIADLAQAFEVV
ncbi:MULTISPECIES: aminotransferase class I/II-fold pyridoxal phosphate-dependent enzyme [unclassified Novosphingobium]|uniref:aminotransferase class I/II-fold pyridoxal phosphate-dependent enzyme n=1 Tax=unclassified Novosphingobium TaxID=2644732 RepID=UPI000EC46B91|nr:MULTISPECIES: aminotransferase class I/II-fold pyridoxal phosphate-dependent enzyme [unclassified Novosphingobium]HCF24807.1 methionine gamma-lyase [Novosphingobium sp.]HQV01981.1 aminotransferase class I/II-fold pyridoxal phosphate-dependent enzyme [Novosphingobium sp.]